MDQTGLHVFSACAPVKAYTKPYHQRRTHKKSRGGCVKCKEKRVRCDEKHPACTRCARRSLDCQYQRSPGSEKSASASPPDVKLQEPCEEEPLPMLSYEHDLALQLGHPAKTLTRSSTRDQLLRHYEVITEHGLVMGPEPKKYHDRVMRMAVDVSRQKSIQNGISLATAFLPRAYTTFYLGTSSHKMQYRRLQPKQASPSI